MYFVTTLKSASLMMGLVLFSSLGTATHADQFAGPVLLPDDTQAAAEVGVFSGAWTGLTIGGLPSVFVIENSGADGAISAMLSVAGQPWLRGLGRISDNAFAVRLGDADWRGHISTTGTLHMHADHGFASAAFSQADLADILDPAWQDDFHGATEIRLEGPQEQNGAATELNTLIYKPLGEGPFPLAVMVHGATDSGKDDGSFERVWTNRWMAEHLVAKGYMVAVPQRRGRGGSSGQYGEGLVSQTLGGGYSCAPDRAAAGYMRAMQDMDAAMVALRQLDAADDTQPALLIGNSRGGVLALAWAGQNKQDVSGVVNFAGGWVEERCEAAFEINASTLSTGAAFDGPTLWVYGTDDTVYGESHTRGLFDSFIAGGGNGAYLMAEVPWMGGGHGILSLPALHLSEFEDFLRDTNARRFSR